MVTIKQLADLANVSRGTIDKVLNNRPGVKESTREKILKIAKEMNYQPNFIGKVLVNSGTTVKIGVILTPGHNAFIQRLLDGIRHAGLEFEAFGIEIITKMATTLAATEQIILLDELVSQGVSGIAVFPIDDPQVIAKVNQIEANGVTIVTFNSYIKQIKCLCFVGQNHLKGGRTAAALMGKLAPKGGEIGVIISSKQLSCHQDRLNGFKEKLFTDFPDLYIIAVEENQDTKEAAFRATLDYCNKFPNLKGIYITSGGISGVGSALQLAGKTKDTIVICHDLVPDSIALLQNETLDFVLEQNPFEQGYQIIKIIFEYLIKGTGPQSPIYEIPVGITVAESISVRVD